MKKLTAEKCFELFKALHDSAERSTKEDYYMQALEYALPTIRMMEATTDTDRQIENDGWIEWGGGARPVRYHAGVNVRYRDGEELEIFAGHIMWTHSGEDDDIIAYRVIENDGREG